MCGFCLIVGFREVTESNFSDISVAMSVSPKSPMSGIPSSNYYIILYVAPDQIIKLLIEYVVSACTNPKSVFIF